MATYKKILIGLVAVLISLSVLLQVDDELSSDAQSMFDGIDWQSPSESYLYLLGLQAPITSDPLTEGKVIFSQYREYEKTFDKQLGNEWESSSDYDDDRPKLNIEHPSLDCNLTKKGCLKELFETPVDGSRSAQFHELKQRYINFMSIGGFRTMAKPHLLEVFPRYTWLVRSRRVLSLDAIHRANEGDAAGALTELYEVLKLETRFMAEADNMIGRMISYVLVNESIEILYALSKVHNVQPDTLPLFQVNQLSLARAMKRELAMSASMSTTIRSADEFRYWPSWAVNIVYKNNISLNLMAKRYANVVRLSEMSHLEFTSHLNNFNEALGTDISFWHTFRNYWGSLLLNIAEPNFHGYIARGLDLNAKIALFNQLAIKQPSPDVLESAVNPYYSLSEGGLKGAFVDQENQRVCFDGPLEDTRFYRCLALLPEG